MKRTSRGFAVFTEFVDTYGNKVRVQQSSAAGVDRCWIFSNYPDGSSAKHHGATGELVSPSPHLTRAQARRVAKALLRFADGGGR
jgi:hypothetical protein